MCFCTIQYYRISLIPLVLVPLYKVNLNHSHIEYTCTYVVCIATRQILKILIFLRVGEKKKIRQIFVIVQYCTCIYQYICITLFLMYLQSVVDLRVPDLAQLLQDTESYAEAIQEACQRHLDERSQTAEAMDLLRLYHKARTTSPYIGEDADSKRQKMSNT